MKKLFFLILFFSFNVLTFGANVYFDNIPGYIYDNGQTFYSDENGHAIVPYHVIVPSPFVCDAFGVRFQDPYGNWSPWIQVTDGCGSHECLKAGTWHVQGRAHVAYDNLGNSDYWMYSSILTFYVVDNVPPSIPQNLSISANSSDNRVKLQWTANSQYDMSSYEISRQIAESGSEWITLAIIQKPSTSFVDQEMYYAPDAGLVHSHYKIRAVDINNNYSGFSSEVSTRTEPLNKKLSNAGNMDILSNEIHNFPNPFNPQTNIVYSIKDAGLVQLKVYNQLGQEITTLVNEIKNPGNYSVAFDGSNLPSGIYICTIKTNNFVKSQKLLLVK